MEPEESSIVISGVGLASGLGLSAQETWQSVLAGACGIGPMNEIEAVIPREREGGQARALPADFAPELQREVRYLRWAIAQALRDARAEKGLPYAPGRCGALLGTTLHGMRAGGQYLRTGDYGCLRDFLAGAVLHNALEPWPVEGLALTTCAACSSGLAAIAMASTLLRSGQLDLVIAGGYDPISEYVYAGFDSLRLVAEGPLRPFARDRRGMKVSEGYGIVVLEREVDARRRGVNPLARISGYGESADAFHLTQPHPQGDGAARAMRDALRRAGIGARDIDLISAHATGTPDNDAGEFAALAQVFGPDLRRVPVIAFKSFLGHTLGAAGAIELILSAMALRDQRVPGCANVRADEVAYPELNLATGAARPAALRRTLNSSLGFGGANTCMVLQSPEAAAPAGETRSSSARRDVLITGVGVIVPGAIGVDALAQLLAGGAPAVPAWTADTGPIPEESIISFLAARRVRRMSAYVKLTLASAVLALRDAGLADATGFNGDCCAILGTSHGSTGFSREYYGKIVKEGLPAANPVLFAEGVPNAAAAQLSLMLGLKGGCQTIVGTRTAGLEALALAAARIGAGEWERALVGAAEEYDPVTNEAYRACGLYSGAGGAPFEGERGFAAGSGAVMFMLESADACAKRAGRARARVQGARAVHGKDAAHLAGSLRRAIDDLGPFEAAMSSANGTWIDRMESLALKSLAPAISALYGYVPELYSVSPLAAIAGVLATGRAPGASDQRTDSFLTLCTGYTGTAAGVKLGLCAPASGGR